MPTVLEHVHISWTGFFVTFGSLVAVLFLRRLLPPSQSKRGRSALLFLAISLVLRLVAAGVAEAGAENAGNVLAFIAILAMAFGVTGVAAMIVFDIVLSRVGWVVQPLVRDLLQLLALVVITLGILRAGGVDVLGLFGASAVLTAVVGLALQSTIANVFAGLSLQTDKTISIGDWISVKEHTGKVHEIKWRSTSMVTKNGDYVIVPNSFLLQNEVVNFTKPTGEHRIWLKVSIAYRHPPNEVRRVLLDAVRDAPGVLTKPAPDCFPTDFGDSAVTYALRYWISDFARDTPIDGEIRTRIWYAVQREGIEIPFPIRTVFMNQVSAEQQEKEKEHEVSDRVGALARLDLFTPLEKEERELLARSMKRVDFAKGEDIIRQGDPGDSLYVIQRGQVAVTLNVEGVKREVATLSAGDFFGEMSLITGEPRTATCSAKDDVSCFLIDHRAFQRVLEVKPKVAEQVAARLGSRQASLEGERDQLSAEARAKRAAEKSSHLLSSIKKFFNLG